MNDFPEDGGNVSASTERRQKKHKNLSSQRLISEGQVSIWLLLNAFKHHKIQEAENPKELVAFSIS